MQAIEPAWATRFYGMAVSEEVAAAAREQLTDRAIDDLVDAHLAINQAYFGGIDKTLSGFVILDDEGDDYTLLDLRDGGQIWWQDHETREVSLQFDSLADRAAGRPATKPRHARRVTTPALLDRYQWLVWMLALPLLKDGEPMQSTDYLVRNAIGRFRYVFAQPEALDAAFTTELRELADDPHLAIYWLLHTTALVDHERRQRVLISVGASDHPLLRAFITRLGQLPLSGDLPIVPDFRARRSLAQSYGAFELTPEQTPAACLRALELAPNTQPLGHGLQVVAGLAGGVLDDNTVKNTLARIPETTPGTALVAAVLEKRAKAGSSSHADVLARSLATSIDPWWAQLEALWQVHELAYDGPALVTATRRILVHDRYHRRSLQMAMRAAQIANEPIEAIYADLGIADALLPPYTKLAEQPDDWQAVVGSMPLPHFRRALAWRVLQRVELNKPSPALAAWAAGEVLGGSDPKRAELVGEALGKLDTQAQTQVVEHAAKIIDGGDHPLVDMLLAFLDGPEPPEHDYAAQFAQKRGKEAAVRALAAWLHEPALFDRVLALVERPGGGSFVDLFFSKLFSPFEQGTYVLPKLDAAQAVRVAKAMIKTKLRHPKIHARNAAGHQLYRFAHPGTETFLIDSLTEYAVRYAAIRGPGGVALDHGKTENDQLEDLVADLYAAVRNLKTTAARTALVERLFAERRSYWRMGSAIAEIWDADLHAQIMALLAERRDARAAGCYAYALRDFVKQAPPLVELTRLIIEWQGDNEVTRGFLHYALIVGMLAALDARDLELGRRANDAASWISDPPLEPDDYARGRTWTNPLDDDAIKARLDRALSGAEPAASEAKPAAKSRSRAKATPNPVAQSDAKATAKAKAKPAAQSDAKATAAAKPAAKPAAHSGAKATAKAKPAAKPTAKPAAKAKVKPAAKAKLKPAVKPKAKPASKPKAKPAAKPAARAKAKPAAKKPKPVTKNAPKKNR